MTGWSREQPPLPGEQPGPAFSDPRLNGPAFSDPRINGPAFSHPAFSHSAFVDPAHWYAREEHQRRLRRQRRRRRLTNLVLAAVLLTATWGVLEVQRTLPDDDVVTQPRSTSPLLRTPSPSAEEQDAPLGQPPLVVSDGAPYAFLETIEDAAGNAVPVTWSPCRPIHYVVNPARAPEGFAAAVDGVVGELSVATGLQFVRAGTTAEAPDPDRDAFQPETYGDRWAPIVIGFTDAAGYEYLSGDTVGVASPQAVHHGLRRTVTYVSAAIWLDVELLDHPPSGGHPAYLPVLRHELAHALGLGHVSAPTQLMYPRGNGVLTFQSGDLYGLAQLGSGPCAPGL